MNDTLAAVGARGGSTCTSSSITMTTESMDFQLRRGHNISGDDPGFPRVQHRRKYRVLLSPRKDRGIGIRARGRGCGVRHRQVYPNQLGTRAFIGFDDVVVYSRFPTSLTPCPKLGAPCRRFCGTSRPTRSSWRPARVSGVHIRRRHHQRVDGGGCRVAPPDAGAFPVLFSLGKVTCQVPGGRIHGAAVHARAARRPRAAHERRPGRDRW